MAAQACRQILTDLEQGLSPSDHRLQAISDELDRIHPESGCTLTVFYASKGCLHLIGVGDSYAYLFARSGGHWRVIHQLGRHVDAAGNPSQLLGAEVPIEAHRFGHFAERHEGCCAAVLMSDGGGAFVGTEDLLTVLSEIGAEQPNHDDLAFYAAELSRLALSRGSRDDISVVVSWLGVQE